MTLSEYARARLERLKSLLVVRFLILVVRGTRARARTHMQILRERARARLLGKKSTNPTEFCMHYSCTAVGIPTEEKL